MAIQSDTEDSRILRQLFPLATFPSEAFKDLCANTTVEQVQDSVIFKRGDSDTNLVYLVNGSVTLQADGLIVEVITSGSESAKFALAHQIPRKIDAVANGTARIIRLDAQVVNNPPPAVYREDMGYTVIEETSEDSDDWMTAVLRLPLFQTLPPSNLQKILISLKKQQFSGGDVIVAKGDTIDTFYALLKGQCLLSRNTAENKIEIKLGPGDSFGEEYLITDKASQETITALSDVSLIQLDRNHFIKEIKNPLIHYIDHDKLPEELSNGAILLDVRLPHLFENQNLAGSANIPLASLRARLTEIPKDKQVIVVCANGKTSEAAAFLLGKSHIKTLVLRDGMGINEIEEVELFEPEPLQPVDNITGLIQQPQDAEVTSVSITAGAEEENQLDMLKAEYARLRQSHIELESKMTLLQADKEKAENRIQVLTQQLERLKEILGRLTQKK